MYAIAQDVDRSRFDSGGHHRAQRGAEPETGVKAGNPSILRKLVSAEKIEQTAELQYGQLRDQASQKRALLPDEHPQVRRVRKITQDLLPHAPKFNGGAKDWHWEVNIINSRASMPFAGWAKWPASAADS